MKQYIMKKIFSLVVVCIMACISMTAQTDGTFTNPINVVDSLSSGAVAKVLFRARCDYDYNYLTADTTIQYQPIELSAMMVFSRNTDKWTTEQQKQIKEKYGDYNILLHCTDVYGQQTMQQAANFNQLINVGLKIGHFGETSVLGYGPYKAGHHRWKIAKGENDILMSGNVVMERKAQVNIQGSNGKDEIIETQSFDVISKIRSGFPYNVEDFQGKVHYKVLAPDSTVVYDNDLQLNASSDSTLLEYIQVDNLCRVENSIKGTYMVELTNAPWIEGGKETHMIWVMDPFMGASSQNPRDVTMVVKNTSFADDFKDWNYEGPERHEIATRDESTAVMIGSPSADPREEGFSLEQTIDSVPAGWYKLLWNAYYQPGATSAMKMNDPVLAEIYANKQAQPLEHIYNCPLVEETSDFIQVKIPKDANSAIEALHGRYANELVFEQKEGGPLTIGTRAQASIIYGATTAFGTPSLWYYGEGKAYGKVEYLSSDTIFAPSDSIQYFVLLMDGIGVAVPDTNKVWIHMYNSETFTKENLVLDSVYTTAKAGNYRLYFNLPDSANFKPGKYYINAGTLHNGKEYEAEATTRIELKFKENQTAVKNVAVDPRKSSSRTYDLSGRRVNAAATRKGNVYINSGKKTIK